MTGMGQKTWISDFVTRQCPVSHIKTGEKHHEITWMGHPSAPAVILWPGAIYHLHALAEQYLSNFEKVGKWLNEWFAATEKLFFWQGIHNLPKRWPMCIEANGQYFESMKNEFPLKIICFLTTKNHQRLMRTPGIYIALKLDLIYLYFPPSSHLIYVCFCPVDLLLL